MMEWLNRHANAISALSALLTAVLALAALIGVKIQIDASSAIQKEQSAKEIYREYLNLSIQKPNFYAPDYCALKKTAELPAYQAYVEYLLYTGEQVIEMDPQWEKSIASAIEAHAAYLCSPDIDLSMYAAEMQAVLASFQAGQCAEVKACP